MLCKNTKSVPKTCWGFPQNYWEIFYKNTQRCSAKNTKAWSGGILRGVLQKYWCVLQKYWKVLCRITEGSSAFWYKMSNLLVKTQGLGLFPVHIMVFYFRGPKDNQLWRAKSFANFSYTFKLKKGDTGDSRSYD